MSFQEGKYESNAVIGKHEQTGLCSLQFIGTNNRLIFGANVKINNATFAFNGNNSVIELCNGVTIHRGASFIVRNGCSIQIGARTSISSPSRFHAEEQTKIVIGAGCLLANVRFRTADLHQIFDIETHNRLNAAADILVEDNVWLAEDVYVYKGVRIGSGSVVGGRSTVTQDLPASALCVGTPAKAVRAGVYWKK